MIVTHDRKVAAIRRRKIRTVAVPLAAFGSVLGCAAMTLLASGDPVVTIVATALTALAAVAMVWGAAYAAVLLTSPWTRDAGSPAHLRTA